MNYLSLESVLSQSGYILHSAGKGCYAWRMPTVLRKGQYRFYFYSDEGQEPPHIHVACGDGEAKFWLRPIRIAASIRLAPSQIRDIERLIFEFQIDLLEAFNEFHS